MTFTWSSELEMGHPLIDSQHKSLIDTLNKLIAGCLQGNMLEESAITLDFLISYTKEHFRDEEKLQEMLKYPDLRNHRKSHEEFMASTTLLLEEFKQTGPTKEFAKKLITNVGNWLVNHIQKEDAMIASYLKKKGT
jgi:hemerythrin